MKIASITVYCNEEFRLQNWITFYNEYKDSISLHIIVNNGNKDDSEKLKKIFPDSLVIYSLEKSLTLSYNKGIAEALKHEDIDSVLLIGNDMKISSHGIRTLHQMLYNNSSIAEISPVVLYKDSRIIETFGCNINFKRVTFSHIHEWENIDDVNEEFVMCSALPGGMNLTKRKVYEECGLQDENLFMYADEIDTGIRYKKAGYVLLATQKAIAWHQHINKGEKKYRNLYVPYLIGRNNMYIAKKHFGLWIVTNVIIIHLLHFIVGCLASIKNVSLFQIKENIAYLKGSFNGLIGNMDNSIITSES